MKKRNVLNLYKKKYLESTRFLEITNPTKTNIIVSLIYRHPTMDLNEPNCYYLNPVLEDEPKNKKVSSFLVT